jgi:hypothetical protein
MTLQHPDDDELVAYALKDLDAPECDAMATHIATCRTCGERVRTLLQIVESSAADPEPVAPEQVLGELLCRAAESRRDVWRWRNQLLRPVPSAIAAIVALLCFAVGFYQGRSASPSAHGTRDTARPASESRGPLPTPPMVPFETAAASMQMGSEMQLSAPSETTASPGSARPRPSRTEKADSL